MDIKLGSFVKYRGRCYQVHVISGILFQGKHSPKKLELSREDGSLLKNVNINSVKLLTEEEKFNQCMKEAENLCYGYFAPEIDNLADQTIKSIVNKVRIETDIVSEGHQDFDPNGKSEKEWLKKANIFIQRWREF